MTDAKQEQVYTLGHIKIEQRRSPLQLKDRERRRRKRLPKVGLTAFDIGLFPVPQMLWSRDLTPPSSLAITLLDLSFHRFSYLCFINMTDSSSEALAALQQLEENGKLKDRLAIIRISDPISTEVGGSYPSPSKRSSDVSVSNFDDPTPASLEADLSHYKVRAMSSNTTNARFPDHQILMFLHRNYSPSCDSPTSSK